MTETFAELGVKPELVSALARQSITAPTLIQIAAIPLLREKKDFYLQAETGTGKTLAYLLPLYARIDPELSNAQVLVLAPTYELAIQIQRQCVELSQLSGLPVRVILLIGGTSRDRQLEKLKKKPHIVIGSPGRIHELIADRKLKTHLVHTVVIDEADRLLVSESLSQLSAIIKSTPRDRSLVFVSATEQTQSTGVVAALAPAVTRVKTGPAPVNSKIDHLYLRCEERDKPELVRKLIYALRPGRSLIFVHKTESAEILAEKLAHHKISVAGLHGEQHKLERKKAMEDFRSGDIKVLIASDVAARGLDIKGVTHVFNFDVPSESGAYLHRVGRTGRAGAAGVAVSLIAENQSRLVDRFRKDLGIVMTEVCLRLGKVEHCSGDAAQKEAPPNR